MKMYRVQVSRSYKKLAMDRSREQDALIIMSGML